MNMQELKAIHDDERRVLEETHKQLLDQLSRLKWAIGNDRHEYEPIGVARSIGEIVALNARAEFARGMLWGIEQTTKIFQKQE